MNVLHEQKKSYAKQLVEEAMLLEKDNPQQSRLNYLEAAEIFLSLSYENPEFEERYVRAAELFGKRAQSLKKKKKSTITVLKTEMQPQKDGITFADVIGVEDVKEQLRLLVIEPFKHPEIYEHYNKNLKGGIVMYGPPGCGKSLIAEATANEAGLAFFHVKPSDIMSKYVGETEKNVAELFEKARTQPSIIFFDEFEVLGGDRGKATEHTKEVISQLLTEMDGLGTKSQAIFCIAATNEPWNIDVALLRDGRFGSSVFVPPPNVHAREYLFQHHLKGRPVDEMNYQLIAENTEHFSGADIKGACEKAVTYAIRDSIESGDLRNITFIDIEKSILDAQSVTQTWFTRAQEQLKKRKEVDRYPEIMRY